jgi:hypothetical protein
MDLLADTPAAPLTNRVAESAIEVFDLAGLWDGAPVDEVDLEPFLFKGLVLRERDFRDQVKAYDWQQHAGHHVALFCSTDAIVPTWAWMLIGSKLEGVAASVTHGRAADVSREFYARALGRVDWQRYADGIVVIKGCGSAVVPTSAYVEATQRLMGVARKLMYGEPCSSVPLWRKPKAAPAMRTTAQVKPLKALPFAAPSGDACDPETGAC